MSILKTLRPKKKHRIMDLVANAGLDVSDWSNFDGHAAANPKYCYEWAYVDADIGIVLNLWIDECQEQNGKITFHGNTRMRGEHLDGASRSVVKTRAKRMEDSIELVSRRKLPIRVVLLDGVRRQEFIPNSKASKVTKRELDAEYWTLEKYDRDTGNFYLVRGIGSTEYCDQFTLDDLEIERPKKVETTGVSFVRNSRIRNWALARAKGNCEYCGVKGFEMSNGKRYLETHHIISLSNDGPDHVTNVIALCPNHHRQAHYGSEREELRIEFQRILSR